MGLDCPHSLYLLSTLEHDRSVILIKACPIFFEWFTTNDIVVASCGHTYHLFCLFTHLQTLVIYVVEFFLEVFHPDWSWSMGISPLLEKQKQTIMDLHLVQQQQQWFQEKINHMQQEGNHFYILIILFSISCKFQILSLQRPKS